MRILLVSFAASLTLLLCAPLCAAGEYTLEAVEAAPDELPDELADLLDPAGYKIVGPRRDYCRVWFLKEVETREDFSPGLTVKYPLTPGQLVGVMSVPRRSEIADFKGQPLEDGLYTLRYGQQPMDGNHLGTSPTSDFLLAVPVDEDPGAGIVDSTDELSELSAEAAGTTHPAVFSLLPPNEAEIEEASLVHDESREFHILQLNANAAGGETLPMRLVLVGESAG